MRLNSSWMQTSRDTRQIGSHSESLGRRLPALGRRGGGWVVAQAVLLAGILLSAVAGRGWSSSYATAAYVAGGVLLTLGLLLLLLAALQLRSALTPFPAPRTGKGLTTNGVFALVRHPMYGGGILIALGWSIIFATALGLGLTVALAVFADLKARREEVWLGETFDEYEAYRRRTPHRLIPFVY